MDEKGNESNGEYELVESQVEGSGQVPTSVPSSRLSFPPPPLPNPYNTPQAQLSAGGQPPVANFVPPPMLPTLPVAPPSSFMPPEKNQASPSVPINTSAPPVMPSAGTRNTEHDSYEVSLDAVSLTPRDDAGSLGHEEPAPSVWGWIPGGNLLSRVAEKAKSQVDSVITTLDPQMKDYLHTSGSIELAVASDKESKIAAVREGFTKVFSHVIVRGFGAPSVEVLPAQPVGFRAALKAAEARIEALRNSRLVGAGVPLIAVEGFLVEIVPGEWHEMAILFIDDDSRHVKAHVVSQSTPVPLTAIEQLKERSSGDTTTANQSFAVPVGEVMGQLLNTDHREWHLAHCGQSRKNILASAAASLAGTYKRLRT